MKSYPEGAEERISLLERVMRSEHVQYITHATIAEDCTLPSGGEDRGEKREERREKKRRYKRRDKRREKED